MGIERVVAKEFMRSLGLLLNILVVKTLGSNTRQIWL